MGYLNEPLATADEVRYILGYVWDMHCLTIEDGWMGTEERFELAEALWGEKFK